VNSRVVGFPDQALGRDNEVVKRSLSDVASPPDRADDVSNDPRNFDQFRRLEVPHVRDETEPKTDHLNVGTNRIEELKGEPGSR
jgi:hypothetical protein